MASQKESKESIAKWNAYLALRPRPQVTQSPGLAVLIFINPANIMAPRIQYLLD